MMEYLELFKTFAFTGQMGFWTYWLPMVLCLIGYSGRTWVQIRDLKTKDKYVPALTVGTIVWRVISSITPMLNIVSLTFGLSYEMLNKVCSWINSVMSFEIVKKTS